MKTFAIATLAALLGSGAQAAVAQPPSQFQELSLGAPQDVLAGDYINMWFRLNIDQFQAPHAAFSEDAWVAYGAETCVHLSDNLCSSFHTYLSTSKLVSCFFRLFYMG